MVKDYDNLISRIAQTSTSKNSLITISSFRAEKGISKWVKLNIKPHPASGFPLRTHGEGLRVRFDLIAVLS